MDVLARRRKTGRDFEESSHARLVCHCFAGIEVETHVPAQRGQALVVVDGTREVKGLSNICRQDGVVVFRGEKPDQRDARTMSPSNSSRSAPSMSSVAIGRCRRRQSSDGRRRRCAALGVVLCRSPELSEDLLELGIDRLKTCPLCGRALDLLEQFGQQLPFLGDVVKVKVNR